MTQLNGKCKEKFLEWLVKNGYPLYYDRIPEILKYDVTKNALIIEFFDSIKCSGFKSLWSYCFGVGDYDVFKDNWNEHIQQAIKKANDLYNERFK